MDIELKEEYRDIDIEECGFSNRTHNILLRSQITNVYELALKFNEGITGLRGAGVFVEKEVQSFFDSKINDTLDEIQRKKDVMQKIADAKAKIDETEELEPENVKSFLETMGQVNIVEIPMSVRVYNGLKLGGITTIKDLLLLKKSDFLEFRNIGATSIDEIESIQNSIWAGREEYFSKEAGEYDDVEAKLTDYTRDFDKIVIADLRGNYNFSTALLQEWFGITRQRVHQKLEPHKKNKDKWVGKELAHKDLEGIKALVFRKSLYEEIEGDKYYFFNNKKDNGVFLCVNDKEIKCFYLADLPDDVQEIVRKENLDKYDSEELASSPLGEKVYILKEPYFKPYDIYKYRFLAHRRGMSLEEYTQFLEGVSYFGGKSITDDQIIEFFEANMVNGKVYISSDSSNHWIRSYASRNGYTLKAFIEFYGYETALADAYDKSLNARLSHIEELKKCIVYDNVIYLDTFSPIYRIISVYASYNGITLNEYISDLGFKRTMIKPFFNRNNDEADMEIYQSAEDAKIIEKIFANNPLLGNYVFSEEKLQKLNSKAKKYVDQMVSDPGVFRSVHALKAEMLVTLAVINYAKKWASEEESSFWNFMSGQFGYRESSSEVRDILCRCVEDSMNHRKRLFLSDAKWNLYKGTIVTHAMATKKTWMYLFDFLFDFYKNNLNWTYMENDPSIEQMVRALYRKLDDSISDSKDEAISISSEVYRFQEGIRKLVLYRPKYTERMFGRLIKRLDKIIKQEAGPANTYEEVLAEEWISKKMLKILETKIRRSWSSEAKDLAISYDRIRVSYRLENETDVKIVLPDIRLKEEDTGNVTMQIYYGDKLVDTKGLSFYGNELGRTVQGKRIDLKECQRLSGANTFDFAVRITCDDTLIYDSGNSLYRSCLVFEKKTEVNPSSCTKGNYTIIIPGGENLEVENAQVNVILEDVRYGNYYYVQFENDFIFSFHDEVLAIDNISNGAIRVIVPNVRRDLSFIKDSIRYKIVSACDMVRIVMSEDDIQGKYVILFNGERISFDELGASKNGLNTIYELPINMSANEEACRIQILDLNRNKLVLNEQFIIVENVLFEFNRFVYYSEKDFDNASLRYSFDDMEPASIQLTKEDEFISVPFANGEFVFSVPTLKVYDTLEHRWGADTQYWIEEIGYETFMRFEYPDSISVKLYLDDYDIPVEMDDSYGLGNVLHGLDHLDKDNVDLKLRAYIDNAEYTSYQLAKIAVKERFAFQPKLIIEDDKLLWDRGYGFVGRKNTVFKLKISSDNGYSESLNLNLEEELIAEGLSLELGEYKYQIVKESGNIFMPSKEHITEGVFFVGDANELRFLHHKICIDKVSFYDSYTDKVMQKEIIKICIDNLKYVGTESVSDDGELPIYTGIVFFENKHGIRKEFSDKNEVTESGTLMKVNPVRVVLLNDSVLSMVDSEGDGFYCWSFIDKNTGEIKYSFTDREYSDWNERFYRGVDLYIYERERMA